MNEEEKKTTTKKSTGSKKTTTKKTTAKKTTTKKSTPKKETAALVEVKEEVVPEKVEEVKKEPKKRVTKKKTVKEVEALPEVKEEVKEEVTTEPETTPVVEEVKEKTDALPVVVPEKEEKIIDEVTDDTIAAEPLPMEALGESVFDGRLIQLIGWYIIGFVLSVVTLGLGAPFAKCFILDWRFKHTKINGKRLCFDGNGLQLWGNYIKWTFFTIITLGIFLLFLPVQWNRWVVKHTHYEGNRKPRINYSLFDGITWEYIGINVLSFFLTVFSLGILAPFCETLMYSWRVNHTTYDTIDMEFDGKGFQLLGNYIKWTFLCIITLGIYGLWVPIRKIQWEVKHTHEKGYAKHPYRPILGMFLPIVLAIACLGAGIFGLTKVKKDTWKDIRTDITHFVDSMKIESDKYSWPHVIAERVADMYYRISTRDLNITWEERYERFFDPTKVDKLSDNYYNSDKDTVEMAFIDLKNKDVPVLLVKTDKQVLVYWLYEKKIESHYFIINDKKGDFKLVTDNKGSRLAFVNDLDDDDKSSCVLYLEDIVDYNSDCKTRVYNDDDKLKVEVSDIHYTKVDLDNMNGFKDAVDYYYDHTEKEYNNSKVFNEDEVNDMFDNTTYQSAYLSYLKAKLEGEANVAIIDLNNQEYPSLVVLEGNKSYILTYFDEEVHESEKLAKASLGLLKKSSKKSEDYVLIATDSSYRYYYFVEAYAESESDYNGLTSIKVKKNIAAKELDSYSYKEVNTSIPLIKVKKNDLSKLEAKFKTEVEAEEEEEEGEVLEETSLDSFKAGEYTLAYGDYKSNLKDETGGTYTLMRDGSYTYINPYGKEKNKTVTVRETGTYKIEMDYKSYKNGKPVGEKVPYICMSSKSKDKTTCWIVDKNNHFTNSSSSNNWTYSD